ncbi:MAG TPA: glycosyltransferase family 4 protein [Thermoanaerobaculia bacterium]|nr:glycosyltransferase family 4 protein [Thermoanaerobaculia bacterium]
MRILWIAQWFPPDLGALPARITEMANVWVAEGHHVTVLTAFPHHPLGQVPPQYRGKLVVREKSGGIDVVRCWLLALPNRRMWQRTLCQVSFGVTALLLGIWRVRKPDVVVVSSPPFFTVPAAWLMARLKRRPFVFEVRDLWPAVFVEMGVMKRGLAYRVLEAMEEFFYRAAARVIVVTRAFREDLRARGVDAAKVGVIPNGADLDVYGRDDAQPRFRAELGGEGKFLVTFVGTHGVATGLEQILDAAAILKDDARFAFAFVGEGAERDRLIESARARGLTNVVFHRAVAKDEVRDVYASSDASIVCLKPVAFLDKFIPSKIFELLASRTPVIAALGEGEAATIVREAGHVVVPAGDGAAIARAIRALAEQPSRIEEMKQRGRAYVAEHFDRGKLARRYIEELRATTKNPDPSG